MIKCDFCKKKIDNSYNVVQLDIVWWFQGEGVDENRTPLGDFHGDCAEKFIKKLKKNGKRI